jgi:hypothetical protein
MPQEDLIKKLIKQRKIIIIAVILLFLIGFAFYFSFYYLGSGMYAVRPPLYERIIPYAPYQPSLEPTIEIKEGRITIETMNADKDSDIIKGYAKDYDGYVENFKKNEDYSRITISLSVKIPIDNFDGFFERIKKDFKIKDSDLQFYRISIKEEISELDILNYTMRDLERIRFEINNMPAGKEKIESLMHLTDRELEIRNKINKVSTSLLTKESLSKFSTAIITLVQEKPIMIVPENLGRQFNEKLRSMIENSSLILMDILTGIIPFALNVVKYIIFGLMIIIPLIVIYIFLGKIYKKFENKFK